MVGQFLKLAGVVGLDPQGPQFELGGGPGEIHRPVDGGRIAVLPHQGKDLLARVAGGDHQGHLGPLAGLEEDAFPKAQDGIQDEPLAVARRLGEPDRVGERPAASDEAAAVGFEPDWAAVRLGGGQPVGDIHRRLVRAARPSVRQQRGRCGHRFGLNK